MQTDIVVISMRCIICLWPPLSSGYDHLIQYLSHSRLLRLLGEYNIHTCTHDRSINVSHFWPDFQHQWWSQLHQKPYLSMQSQFLAISKQIIIFSQNLVRVSRIPMQLLGWHHSETWHLIAHVKIYQLAISSSQEMWSDWHAHSKRPIHT